MESKRAKRYYLQEYKVEIVKRCLSGESSKAVARATGICCRLIRNWITLYNTLGEEELENKRRPGNPLAGYVNKKNLYEVEQLRYELAKAEIEIAKLKKYTKRKGGAADQRDKTILLLTNILSTIQIRCKLALRAV